MKKVVYEILPKFEVEEKDGEVNIRFNGVSTGWISSGRARNMLAVLQCICELSEIDISTVTAMYKMVAQRKQEGDLAMNLNEYWSDDDRD